MYLKVSFLVFEFFLNGFVLVYVVILVAELDYVDGECLPSTLY